jgi:3-oxoacyl-[acyl-carrier protein] reductase
MNGRLAGKVAVVTGGANGIGQAFCRRLALEGASVVIADIEEARETLEMISAEGKPGLAVQCDLTSASDVDRLRQEVEQRFGSADILVHCAGIYPTRTFDEIEFTEWSKVMSVNFDSMYHLTKAFLPHMVEKRWGRIVGIASATFHGGIAMCTHYSGSKGALIGFTRSLATEVGEYGVTVNCIAPGLVRTKTTEGGIQKEQNWFEALRLQQAIKRVMEPEDLTGPLAFLVSDDSAFITGQTLIVDGGWRFS